MTLASICTGVLFPCFGSGRLGPGPPRTSRVRGCAGPAATGAGPGRGNRPKHRQSTVRSRDGLNFTCHRIKASGTIAALSNFAPRAFLSALKLSIAIRSLVVFAALTAAAQAETRYVTDQLTITVRTGQDSSYRVLKAIPTGTKVEILGENKETGYSHIRTPDGTEGYSLTRYLMDEPPAQTKVAELKKQIEQLQAKPGDAQKELNDLRSEYQSLKLKYDSLEFENVQLSQRMDAVKDNASNVVSLMNERDEALQRANRLSSELEELKVRNTELENHSDKKWFMAGAGVLILGIVVGIILPRVGVRRRGSRWGSGDFSF